MRKPLRLLRLRPRNPAGSATASSPDSCLILIPEYKAVYKQRTADERSHSQAVAIGSERPKLRRQSAIANQNTLIYVLINLRALQRVRTTKEQLAHQPKLPG